MYKLFCFFRVFQGGIYVDQMSFFATIHSVNCIFGFVMEKMTVEITLMNSLKYVVSFIFYSMVC